MTEFSKEVQISVEIGVELFKELIVSAYRGVAGFVKDKNREHDFFGTATRKYVGGLIRRYNEVQVLGMREPVPLKSLFVRANILEKITARTGLMRPEDLHDFFDFDRRAFGKTRETVDGEIIVNKLQKFIVLGKPGAGKTTYLKYLTLMMLDQFSRIERRKLPVFITLREWADTGKPLMDFIVDQLDICGFEQAGAFVEQMLQNGQCLVLFDGLDEVSEAMKQDDVIRQIKDFADKYYENQFVVSCRVAAYNHWLTGFTEVEMADFNEAQMEAFIKNWFHGDPKTAAECWERLKASAPLKELASVPLLLTLLCLEYGESNDFPPNRAELYRRAVDTLLTKWDSTRRIRRQEVYQKLSLTQKESMFARIAVGTFAESQYFIAESDLRRMIENFIEYLPSIKEQEITYNSRDILKSIEAQHGIFVERAKGVYSFAHLTFQEYFTAKYIVNNVSKGTLNRLVDRYFHQARWKEVFLLTANALFSSDELLMLMFNACNSIVRTRKITELLEFTRQLMLRDFGWPKNYADPVKRTIILMNQIAFIKANDQRTSRNKGSVLMKTRSLLHTLVLLTEPSIVAKLDQMIDNIQILSYLNANYWALNLSNKDFDDLDQYITAYSLLLQCLNGSSMVAKPVRMTLLNGVFLPFGSERAI